MKATVTNIISALSVEAKAGDKTIQVDVPINNPAPQVGDDIEVTEEKLSDTDSRFWHKLRANKK